MMSFRLNLGLSLRLSRGALKVCTGLIVGMVCSTASSVELATSVGYSHMESDSDSDLSSAASYAVRLVVPIADRLGIETSLHRTDEAKESGEDLKGEYEFSISTRHANLGLMYRIETGGNSEIYTRAGMSYGVTRIAVEESFYGLRPAGEASEEDEGYGYWAGLGWSFARIDNVMFGVDLEYHLREALFADESNHDFALNTTQMAVHMRWLLE